MKKFTIFLAVALVLVANNIYAASIGGIPTVKQGEFALGTDLSFNLGQDLTYVSADGLSATESYKDSEVDSGYDISLKASYGVLDHLSFYAKIGLNDCDVTTDYYNASGKQSDLETDADMGMSYGLGVAGSYELDDGWIIGGDLQYFYADLETTATNTPVSGAVQVVEYGSQKFSGWHIASYIGKTMNEFTPYIGIRYSDADLKISKPNMTGVADNIKLEADDNFGIFLGTDYAVADNWKVNLEVRLLDEEAVSCGVEYKF